MKSSLRKRWFAAAVIRATDLRIGVLAVPFRDFDAWQSVFGHPPTADRERTVADLCDTEAEIATFSGQRSTQTLQTGPDSRDGSGIADAKTLSAS